MRNFNFVSHGGNGKRSYPATIYLFKVSNRNTRERCEICSKLTIKIVEKCMKYVLRQQKNTRTMLMRRSGVFLVSIDFELENVSWVPLQS